MDKSLEWNEFLFCNGEPFCKEEEWKTPNTYSSNYDPPSAKSGVYCFVVYTSHMDRGNVVYVGSSKSIETRYRGHAVKAALYQEYWYVRFYFKECDNYKQVEKELILKFQPRFNIQHRQSRSLNKRITGSIPGSYG
jgi:excinuclease UvrABC nuclease subunit